MPSWKLTVRHGPEVAHAELDDLDEAVEEMRRRALEIRARGPAESVSMLREFRPADRVTARLQLTGEGRFLRRPVAGVDVRGDGTFVPFRGGGLRREELDPTDWDTPFDPVREALGG